MSEPPVAELTKVKLCYRAAVVGRLLYMLRVGYTLV